MTTIDRDRLRRYLSHATMLLPPDERVVTVAEGAAMLDALSAAERRATRAEAQSETRRQQTVYWQERAEQFEAERDYRKRENAELRDELIATQEHGAKMAHDREDAISDRDEAEARIQAVDAELERHEKHLGADPLIPADRIRRALDAP